MCFAEHTMHHLGPLDLSPTWWFTRLVDGEVRSVLIWGSDADRDRDTTNGDRCEPPFDVTLTPIVFLFLAVMIAGRMGGAGFIVMLGAVALGVLYGWRNPAAAKAVTVWARLDSNQGATDYESAALTAELRALAVSVTQASAAGRSRRRVRSRASPGGSAEPGHATQSRRRGLTGESWFRPALTAELRARARSSVPRGSVLQRRWSDDCHNDAR